LGALVVAPPWLSWRRLGRWRFLVVTTYGVVVLIVLSVA
jgi:hypothetical protein